MFKRNNGWFALAAAGTVAIVGAAVTGPQVVAQMGVQSSASDRAAQVGQQAPDFTLKDTDGKSYTLSDYTKDGKIVVLEWFNPMCPYCVRHYDDQTTMNDTYKAYKDKGVVWFAINSGREGHATQGKDAEYKEKWNIAFPVLQDPTGKVGKSYGARTTPHMYIIDSKGTLVYSGAIDNDRSGRTPKDQRVNYVAQALDEVIAGETVTQAETRPYGCSVKY